MLRNHFKTAWRFLKKNLLVTSISVISLAIGICATLIIFLMVRYDFSFDKHLPHGDRVYKVVSDGGYKGDAVLVPLIRAMQTELTGVEAVVPNLELGTAKLKIEKEAGQEEKVFPNEEGLTFSNEKYFRSEEHTSELQSRENLVCRLLLDKKKT